MFHFVCIHETQAASHTIHFRFFQLESSKGRSPPFFNESTSYFTWLSTWTRFMVETSHSNEKSRYSALFYACRAAIRSEAGIGIMEFLLPLLVLDTICFGDEFDRNAAVMEINQVLSSCTDGEKIMEKMELQKSVAVVFMVIETFQSWADKEIEEKFSSQRAGKSSTAKQTRSSDEEEKSNWPADDSVMFIENFLKAIPLSQCAKAATVVGMYSQALRFSEIEVRKKNVRDHYEAVISNDIDENCNLNPSVNHSLSSSYEEDMDLGLVHYLLGELNDCDSMNAVSKLRKQQAIMEDIREKEADADWDGVLKLCEQASQTGCYHTEKNTDMFSCLGPSMDNKEKDHLSTAYLKALLELGLLDSVLNRVRGMLPSSDASSTTTLHLNNDGVSLGLLIPHAVQASWRLSRWDTLDQLLTHEKEGQEVDLEGQYNIAFGKAMLALHRKNHSDVMSSLTAARKAIIPSLSVAARENYIRTYPYFLKLHCLREVEDSCSVLCLPENNDNVHLQYVNHTNTDWGWEARLNTVGTNTSASINIIQTRLALTRMSSNKTTETEASLWLEAGKKARKSGLYDVAENYLSHADAAFQCLQTNATTQSTLLTNCLDINASEVRLQLAKIKHAMGKSTEALLMVKQKDFDALLVNKKSTELMEKVVDKMREDDKPNNFLRIALQATEWMVESGLKSGSEVIARYKLLNKMLPNWERGKNFSLQRLTLNATA